MIKTLLAWRWLGYFLNWADWWFTLLMISLSIGKALY